MPTLILFNKPFRVLSQFTDSAGRGTLADYIREPGFYAAGRLDYDSEGLLLLCDDGRLQQRIADPRFKLWKTYWLQLEGEIDDAALAALRSGVALKDGMTRRARVRRIAAPPLWEREPPIRTRLQQATCWLEMAIAEGRNRQLRRMCAQVGYPVLRLVRIGVGDWQLGAIAPGHYRMDTVHLPAEKVLRSKTPGPRRRR